LLAEDLVDRLKEGSREYRRQTSESRKEERSSGEDLNDLSRGLGSKKRTVVALVEALLNLSWGRLEASFRDEITKHSLGIALKAPGASGTDAHKLRQAVLPGSGRVM